MLPGAWQPLSCRERLRPLQGGKQVSDQISCCLPHARSRRFIRSSPYARLDIPHGSRARARFDYFTSGAVRPPLFVFIHGGYGSATTRTCSPFSPTDHVPAGSTSPSLATRWRQRRASPTSSEKFIAHSPIFASLSMLSDSTAIGCSLELVGWRTSHGNRLRPSGVSRRDSNQWHF